MLELSIFIYTEVQFLHLHLKYIYSNLDHFRLLPKSTLCKFMKESHAERTLFFYIFLWISLV